MSSKNTENIEMLLSNDEFMNQVKKQQTLDQIFMIGIIGVMGTLASLGVYFTL